MRIRMLPSIHRSNSVSRSRSDSLRSQILELYVVQLGEEAEKKIQVYVRMALYVRVYPGRLDLGQAGQG